MDLRQARHTIVAAAAAVLLFAAADAAARGSGEDPPAATAARSVKRCRDGRPAPPGGRPGAELAGGPVPPDRELALGLGNSGPRGARGSALQRTLGAAPQRGSADWPHLVLHDRRLRPALPHAGLPDRPSARLLRRVRPPARVRPLAPVAGTLVRQRLKSLLVDLTGGFLFLWVPYLLLAHCPRSWWIDTTLLSVPFSFFVMLIAPIWIDPLFNEFGPMKDRRWSARSRLWPIVPGSRRAGSTRSTRAPTRRPERLRQRVPGVPSESSSTTP